MSGASSRWSWTGKAAPPIYRASEAPPPDDEVVGHQQRNRETVERMEREMAERQRAAEHATAADAPVSPTRQWRCACGTLVVWRADERPPATCAFCGAEVRP